MFVYCYKFFVLCKYFLQISLGFVLCFMALNSYVVVSELNHKKLDFLSFV